MKLLERDTVGGTRCFPTLSDRNIIIISPVGSLLILVYVLTLGSNFMSVTGHAAETSHNEVCFACMYHDKKNCT